MTGLLRGLTVGRRLVLITVAFTVPTGAIIIYLIASGFGHEIDFAVLEKSGNEYQRPLETLLKAIPEHRLAVSRQRQGSAGQVSDLAGIEQRIDKGFAALEAVQARLGDDLQFTAEGLAGRKRDHIRVATVKAEWQELQRASATWSPESLDEKHLHLTADVRMMIRHSGDTSNLILDPDLDSYYLMDATLLALPQTQDRTATIMVFADGLARRHAVTERERIQVAVFADLLQESDVDRVNDDMVTALNEDRNFQGVSRTLQQQLPSAAASYRAANEALVAALKNIVAKPGQEDLPALVAAGAAAREASFALWDAGVLELDRLLDVRIAARASSRLWAFVMAAMVWATIQVFVVIVSRSITRPLLSMSSALTAAAGGTASAATQVATSAQRLSRGATEQAASLEEASASMQEMASKTHRNAESSQAAADLVAEVDARVTSSNGALGAMVASMGAIRESSEKVGHIIKAIDEIAFQTNILALNAAVEAARAGDAGMGFAVVADEVRNLAQRSAGAARDTAALIEASIEKARGGASQVGQVTTAIEGIAESVAKVKGLVDEVSTASRQQSMGIRHVSQAIVQVEKVTQSTAATAQECAAASELLNSQAASATGVVRELEALVGGAA